MDEYEKLTIDDFAALLKKEISVAGDIEIIEEEVDLSGDNTFAKRLVTGQAAEKYFEVAYNSLPEFQDFSLENTTRLGCGFDFKMNKDEFPFLAVEVKGMTAAQGTIALTSKEQKTAQYLGNRYYLFVVHNFIERPYHTIYRNPLKSNLIFERRETSIVQVSWSANIRD